MRNCNPYTSNRLSVVDSIFGRPLSRPPSRCILHSTEAPIMTSSSTSSRNMEGGQDLSWMTDHDQNLVINRNIANGGYGEVYEVCASNTTLLIVGLR